MQRCPTFLREQILGRLVMGVSCKRCGSAEHVKNGLMRGKQRYLCKECGLV